MLRNLHNIATADEWIALAVRREPNCTHFVSGEALAASIATLRAAGSSIPFSLIHHPRLAPSGSLTLIEHKWQETR